MISSKFSLDHRLAELRPTADEERVARQLRDATFPVRQLATSRRWLDRGAASARLSRATAG